MASETPSEDLGLGVYDPRFQDALKAADYLESIRWPNGPTCPHCGVVDEKHYRLRSDTRKLWKCRACRKQFTVTVGTIFEGSHIPLNKWLLAFYLLCSSKKGMSAHQLHRMLGITYKSAWFMAHRIRYAMTQLSVFASPAGESAEKLAEIGGFGYPIMRLSTVGKIRAAGFDVVPEGRYGHGQVTLPDVTNATVDRFRAAFGPLIPNPATERRNQ